MSYTLVVVLDGLVVILAFILNPIAKRRLAHEKQGESESGPISPTDRHDLEESQGADEGVVDQNGEKLVRLVPMPDHHFAPKDESAV